MIIGERKLGRERERQGGADWDFTSLFDAKHETVSIPSVYVCACEGVCMLVGFNHQLNVMEGAHYHTQHGVGERVEKTPN